MGDGFDFLLPVEYSKAAVMISLLSVWVLIGVFAYLNRYTRRDYFRAWTTAWLFYALWLTLDLSVRPETGAGTLAVLKQWCVGTAAVFLLWGCASFLELPAQPLVFGLFMVFLAVWGWLSAGELGDLLLIQLPVFVLMGTASVLAGVCFWRVRARQPYLGAGLLGTAFTLWGAYLALYPVLQRSEHLVCAGFFISAVLQLFIAVSMIVLVLEEARVNCVAAAQEARNCRSEADSLRCAVDLSEERYRALFHQASDGIVVADALDLRILDWNPAARRMLGGTEADPGTRFLPEFLRPGMGASAPLLTGASLIEWLGRDPKVSIQRADGSRLVAEAGATEVATGGRRFCQVFLRDVTERERLEGQLRSTEKLAAMGRMVSSVAHELNNPLTIIKGHLELTLGRHNLDPGLRADLHVALGEADRAARLIRHCLTFARRQAAPGATLDLNQLVQKVVDLRRADSATGDVEWIVDLDPAAPTAAAEADRVQQVLTNLIGNALQALQGRPAPRQITVRTQKQSGRVQLEVRDNGPGVPVELVPRLFEPFFTTKEAGAGTGLGLSIAHSIVQAHQGRLYYRPSPGGGASFVAEFPLSGTVTAPPALAAGQPAPVPVRRPARTNVLVLDPEKLAAQMLAEMLRLLGHHVTVCESPKDALDLLGQGGFAAVLTDLESPRLDGRAFYEALQRLLPQFVGRVGFVTGPAPSDSARAFLQSAGSPCLARPFDLLAVKVAVDGLLAAADPALAATEVAGP